VLLHVAVLVVSTIALLYYLPPEETITALVYWFGIVASYLAIIVIAVVLLVFKQYIALLLDIFLISGWSVISYVYLGFIALPVVCDRDLYLHPLSYENAKEYGALIYEYKPDRDSIELPTHEFLHFGRAFTFHAFRLNNYSTEFWSYDSTETIFMAETSNIADLKGYYRTWDFEGLSSFSNFIGINYYSSVTEPKVREPIVPDPIVVRIIQYTDSTKKKSYVVDSIVFKKTKNLSHPITNSADRRERIL
jgi:hypothetical protein